jgi:phosphomannomutase
MGEIFRAYDIRGSYPDKVNEDISQKIGSAFVQVLSGRNKDAPLSELAAPLRKYPSTGEINIRIKDKKPVFAALGKSYSDAETDHLDGLTIQYQSWWFNLRPSNTEPLIRLNMEADDTKTLEEKKKEVLAVIKLTDPSLKVVQ